MVIRNLTIQNYRGVGELQCTFPRSRVVLEAGISDTVLRAIGIVLKSTELAGPPGTWELEANSAFTSEILLQNRTLYVSVTVDKNNGRPVWRIFDGETPVSPTEYFYKVHVPPAEEKANCYLANRSYREVLESYREPEKYYGTLCFSMETEGIGNTSAFRQATSEAVKACKELNAEKTDNLQLFVRVNTLWQKVQAVRDLHHEGWPVFIYERPPEEAESKMIKKLRRQVFFVL